MTVARIIPEVRVIAARPNGGTLVYDSYAEGDEGGLHILSSWDASRTTALRHPDLAAQTGNPFTAEGSALPVMDANGTYWVAKGKAYYQSDTATRAVSLGYKHVWALWPSPSGSRILLAANNLSIVDRVHGGRTVWAPKQYGGIQAVWTSDSELLAQVDDTPTDSGWGTVYRLKIDRRGRITSKRVPGFHTCPAPSPNGEVWAVVEDSELVFYKPNSRSEIMRWHAKEWEFYPNADQMTDYDGYWGSGAVDVPVWCDDTHVAVSVAGLDSEGNANGSVWIVDCSQVLPDR